MSRLSRMFEPDGGARVAATHLHIAVLGAFPFPLPQGSQIFASDQLRALGEAGAAARLFAYGRGEGPPPADLPVQGIPRWLSPRRFRSGPHWLKPAADAALLGAYLRAHRLRPFSCALAHNAEATAVALAGRLRTGVPVVYVAHTLWGWELASYAPRLWQRPLRGVGGALDRDLARRADGVLALSEEAARALAPHARGPLQVIPPGLVRRAPPPVGDCQAACARHGLSPGRYALYAGNLDGYQNLALLSAAARALPRTGAELIVATHDASRAASRAPGLRCIGVADFAEMRALMFAAGVLVLPRRLCGGFPIKLLDYMETGRPIVAHQGVACGLEHDTSARLLARSAGPDQLGAEITRLLAQPAQAQRLGQAARAQLARAHAWPDLAQRTLDLLTAVTRRSREAGSSTSGKRSAQPGA